ncbi:hypothetical protein NJB14197_45310 [Mycobacterium montefiorense]|uniref:DUF222 domain-containing protein n=1 Tax=Mycobacterium montefiorense TaxID=154654 RepID=A0AA37UVB3_9MYCO|nr:13E12 repeat family protein [Mycobacterium montefiorense]GBG39055.1 hypothetical protein MmonteBS_34270 [Mycobacterium montefiorense]GKU32843.1 hypothetical protein NJB14191_01900 [Mycobacterium montefiorense]GKU38364.1 hypothetical protein NJB14192_03620 [Mycobacterium montefiorense]GKU47278.1 hypothetical protein NJB14194_38960 [Mycobacterium montefiorense]GKU50394.1 hypothetical protein NJB14195_16400 [Mycobacterium montefiorense]
MGSSSREEIVEVFDALDADLKRLRDLSFDVLTTPERLRALEHLESAARRLRAPQHELINQVGAQASPAELGGTLRGALADRLRITKAEASRRIDKAEDLGERRALTGESLAPQLAATAAAQREGLIGDAHIRVIRNFFAHLPTDVDGCTREAAEADLARTASHYRPDELAKYARRIMDWLNPDGEFSDQQRARKRGLILGEQEFDGMSKISGLVTPELRAAIEAMLAKLAVPGACNPDDEIPVVDAIPEEETVRRDSRSPAQRNHDGLLAGLRALFVSGKLGSHNGLPVSIVVTTTLRDLEAATGKALTGGRSLVPMSDVIHWAGHAHHYLAIFDQAKPLALHHTKRLASPAQRIMLPGAAGHTAIAVGQARPRTVQHGWGDQRGAGQRNRPVWRFQQFRDQPADRQRGGVDSPPVLTGQFAAHRPARPVPIWPLGQRFRQRRRVPDAGGLRSQDGGRSGILQVGAVSLDITRRADTAR